MACYVSGLRRGSDFRNFMQRISICIYGSLLRHFLLGPYCVLVLSTHRVQCVIQLYHYDIELDLIVSEREAKRERSLQTFEPLSAKAKHIFTHQQ